MAVEKDSIGGGIGRSSWRRTITKGFAVLAKVYVQADLSRYPMC